MPLSFPNEASPLVNAPIRSWTSLPSFQREIDIAVATVLLCLLAPMLWVIILLMLLDSRGPILVRETRRGYR